MDVRRTNRKPRASTGLRQTRGAQTHRTALPNSMRVVAAALPKMNGRPRASSGWRQTRETQRRSTIWLGSMGTAVAGLQRTSTKPCVSTDRPQTRGMRTGRMRSPRYWCTGVPGLRWTNARLRACSSWPRTKGTQAHRAASACCTREAWAAFQKTPSKPRGFSNSQRTGDPHLAKGIRQPLPARRRRASQGRKRGSATLPTRRCGGRRDRSSLSCRVLFERPRRPGKK